MKKTAVCPDCLKKVGYGWRPGSAKPLFDSHADEKGEPCKGAGWHVHDCRVEGEHEK